MRWARCILAMIVCQFYEGRIHHEREDTVVWIRQPRKFSEDPLAEIIRMGARRLLAQAVEMEAAAFVERQADRADERCRRRIAGHGYLPERAIQTGIDRVVVLPRSVTSRA